MRIITGSRGGIPITDHVDQFVMYGHGYGGIRGFGIDIRQKIGNSRVEKSHFAAVFGPFLCQGGVDRPAACGVRQGKITELETGLALIEPEKFRMVIQKSIADAHKAFMEVFSGRIQMDLQAAAGFCRHGV